MKKLRLFSLLWPIMAMGLIFFSGCKEEVPGCNNSQAQNYDSSATENDGTCTYDKDKFLGDYLSTFVCENPILKPILDSDSLAFTIKEPVDQSDKSLVIFSMIIDNFPVDLESTIEGDVLTIDDTEENFVIPGVVLVPDSMAMNITADVTGLGSATLTADNQLNGTLNLTIVSKDASSQTTLLDICVLMAEKL